MDSTLKTIKLTWILVPMRTFNMSTKGCHTRYVALAIKQIGEGTVSLRIFFGRPFTILRSAIFWICAWETCCIFWWIYSCRQNFCYCRDLWSIMFIWYRKANIMLGCMVHKSPPSLSPRHQYHPARAADHSQEIEGQCLLSHTDSEQGKTEYFRRRWHWSAAERSDHWG